MLDVILFTNRNLIVFTEEGEQDAHLQGAVDCYEINEEVLQELLSQPARYYISKWREWKHEITRQEFEYLLGQRTREKDIADLEKERCCSG